MSSYTESQIKLAMEAPVVHPTAQRKSKIIAIQRMALAASLKSSLKKFSTRSLKKTNIRTPLPKKKSKTAQKKAHAEFKRELKATRRKLKMVWKEKAKSLKKSKKTTKKLSESQIKENKMSRAFKTEMKRQMKASQSFKAKFGVSIEEFSATMARHKNVPQVDVDAFDVFIC